MPQNFYVAPLGGMNLGQEVGSAIRGGEQVFRQRQIRERLPQVMQSGDPERMAAFMAEFPEASQAVSQIAGFRDDMEKQAMLDSAKQILIDDADPVAVLEQRLGTLLEQRRDTTKTEEALAEARKNPNAAKERAARAFSILDPQGYTAYTKSQMAAEVPETANIKDWRHYRNLQKTDPEAAAEFAKQIGIKDATPPEAKPTVAMQNFQTWQNLPAGPEKNAFGRMIGMDPKKTQADLRKEAEAQDEIRSEVNTAETTLGFVDNILANPEYVDALTGIRGATPWSVPGSTGYDAMVAFEQLKGSLTLDNLSKMSGVLSDTDIKILQSEGAGMEPGMSKEALKKRLQTIKTKLQNKAAEKRKQLRGPDEPLAGGGSQPSQRTEAPPAALQYLRANPQAAEQFRQKYGYLPEGF